MKVLVTGATGFLGRRLVARLLAYGHQVAALVRRDDHGLPEAVAAVRGDLLEPGSLAAAGADCERVYHLAALITFDPARAEELRRTNAGGTANLLAAAEGWGTPRTVVASSAITLGLASAPDATLDEEAPADPRLAARNPYMASKLETERIALEAGAVVVNPTTVYGPGDDSLNSGTLIQKVATAPVLPVPSGGGNAVDVDDVVEGFVAAGERGTAGRRYVLGGQNLRFGEIFETVAGVVGHRPLLVPVPAVSRPLFGLAAGVLGKLSGGRFLTPQLVEDLFAFKYYRSVRAREELGWTPRWRFEDSVRRAWSYYRERGLL